MPPIDPPILWLVVAVLLGIVEAASPMLVCIWFCLGAACAFVASLFVDSLFVQAIVFVVASLAMLLALRPFFRRRSTLRESAATDVDAIVGRQVTVTQAIPEGGQGRALLGDTTWNARATQGAAVASGTRCVVAEVSGTCLVVRPERPDAA